MPPTNEDLNQFTYIFKHGLNRFCELLRDVEYVGGLLLHVEASVDEYLSTMSMGKSCYMQQ